LHLLHVYSVEVESIGFSDRRFSLYRDLGFAEFFQYPKMALAALLMIGTSRGTRRRSYLIWAALFLYLLLDDSLRVHERAGRAISGYLEYAPALHLRAQDYGELTVFAAVGVLFATPLLIAWWRGDADLRRDYRDLALLVGCLALVGVVLDLLHVMVQIRALGGAIGLLEDGGEMIVMSVICWYTYRLFLRRSRTAPEAKRPRPPS
jgi:hypothetical protein